jgi:hypothetical protein
VIADVCIAVCATVLQHVNFRGSTGFGETFLNRFVLSHYI